MRLTEYARSADRQELLAQWHPTRNGTLRPEDVTTGSEKSVWWRCERGHEWQSLVSLRTQRGQGCPYCVGQRVISGETDLLTRYPEVAARWHPTRNGGVLPEEVMPYTHRRYWWQCEKGHEWQGMPLSLLQGCGCPYCAGKKAIPGQTDLVTLRPDLAEQWHPEQNGNLSPRQISPGSTKKVWWLCERGHPYQSMVFSRAEGCGCPYCAGKKAWSGFNDLATTFPQLARQWHRGLNGALKPEHVTRGSHKAVWWECAEGHVWKAVVFSRTRAKAAGCPVCTGKTKKRAGTA